MTNSRMGVDELVNSVGLGPVEFPHGATKAGIPIAGSDALTYYVATKSAGDTLAASLADGATVIVTADESLGSVRVRYTVASGLMTDGVPDEIANLRDHTVALIADLAALPKPSLPAGRTVIVNVAGFSTTGDGGGGRFYWSAGSSETAIAGMIVNPTGNAGSGRWKRAYHEVVYPFYFGAKGDGANDDTAEMRLWMAFDAGEHNLGGADRTYIVAPPSAGDIIIPVPSGKKRKIENSGATIKIKNSSLGFFSIIGSASITDDLSDFSAIKLKFDQNSQNNTYSITGSVLTDPRYTISALKGSRIKVNDCEVYNAVCTNSLFINGHRGNGTSLVFDVEVIGNKFFNVGGSAVVHDHSTLYIVADGMRILNNYGSGASLGATGTAAFIETHGSRQMVVNNECENYVGFSNISGIYDAGNTENSLVALNRGLVLNHGVRIFSLSYATHTSGYGIDGLTVTSNRMRIRQSLLGAGSSKFYIAYGVQSGATLPTRNIQINNNVVEYDLEAVTPSYTAISCAVGYNETTGTIVHENFEAEGNTIINAPAMAIALGIGGGVFKDTHIGPNRIVNPGQGLSGSISSGLKVAIWGSANQYTGSLTIDKQSIVDQHAVTRMVNGVFLSPTNSSTGIPCTVELDITLDGDKAAFSGPFVNSGSRLSMIAIGRQNKAFSPTGQTFLAGSKVLDTVNNLEYRVDETGTLWPNHGYASAAPTTGLHQVGSTRKNTAPTAGGFFGFVCTTAGTPGTWKTYGAISA